MEEETSKTGIIQPTLSICVPFNFLFSLNFLMRSLFHFFLFCIVLNSGAILWFQQFGAMFLKKGLNSVRFWEALVWQLLLPILFIVFGLLFGKFLPGYNSNDPPRVITIDSSSESNNRTFFLAQSDNIDWLNYNYTADIQFDVS